MLIDRFIVANIALDLFGLALMFILLVTSKKIFTKAQDLKYLRWAFIIQIIIMTFDLLTWLLGGLPGRCVYVLLYIAEIGYFQSQINASIIWGKYVHYRITGKVYTSNQEYVFSTMPQILMAVFLFTNPVTGYMFTIGPNNVYARGPLCNIISICVMGYIFGVSIWALYKSRIEVVESKRYECKILFMFAIPPIAGGILQVMYYGIGIIWPLSCIGMLLVYITKTQDEISQDALTGLNNRGNLDKYLSARIEEKDETTVLILMDVDKFKEINDKFGHDTGDEALRVISKCIKESFGVGKNFISRYGGDEFVVVIPDGNAAVAQAKIMKFANAIKALNDTDKYLFKLSVSCGYAVYPQPGITDTKTFVAEADKQMYEVKTSHHQNMITRKKRLF